MITKEIFEELMQQKCLNENGLRAYIAQLKGEILDLAPEKAKYLSSKIHSKCCNANIYLKDNQPVCRSCGKECDNIDMQDY